MLSLSKHEGYDSKSRWAEQPQRLGDVPCYAASATSGRSIQPPPSTLPP